MTSLPLPSGRTAAAIEAELAEFARLSGFEDYATNLFDEGPHLVSTPQLPWGDEVRELAVDAYRQFIHGENWISGAGYRRMEQDITGWLGAQLGAPAATGLMTAGGTESNIVALLAARERAGGAGSVVLPATSHYSLFKACALLGLTPVPVEPRHRFELVGSNELVAALRPDTCALVATAGAYGTGWVDPIDEIAAAALERGLLLHVDACCGGFILPFLEADPTVPDWEFRSPGVSSISVDFHKHGMSPPPASMILFRDAELLAAARQAAPPHGGILGTRAAGPVAAAWTMIQALDVPGYRATAQLCMRIRDELQAVVETFPELSIVPGSRINFLAVYSETIDLGTVWARLRELDWTLSYATQPIAPTLILWALPQNAGCADRFARDLRLALADAPRKPVTTDVQPSWLAVPYGGVSV